MDLVIRLRAEHPAQGASVLIIFTSLMVALMGSGSSLQAEEPTTADSRYLPASNQTYLDSEDDESREMTEQELEEALEKRVRTVKKGTSQRSARKAGLEALPLDKMDQKNRAKAEKVISSLSLFRELPTLNVDVNPEIYRFFVQNPDVAVSIWRVMQISDFKMWQTNQNEYEADAGDGTIGVLDVLLRSDSDNVIYCEGEYKSPLLRNPIQGEAVLHLQTNFSKDNSGTDIATHRLYMYVSFPSQSIETVARVISPVSNIIVDRNFKEISLFLNMMTLAMTRQPGWVHAVSTRMEGVLELRKTQLLQLTEVVNQQYEAQKLAGQEGNRLSSTEPPTSDRAVIQTSGRPLSN
ncbi:hypothetical protein Pla110_04760 [Polystyrenella longa]|uniref:Uncharacterized protein n=1 Tax=Polystyrenella longa TaxID=2528007 RepID=A0A518CHS4_9PLAN|nr:hypothetical protein [Polystyrenella longa]QDU78772.1 hypothetical protein Pla110_04760 [Polystyrenella longa]